MPVLTEEEYKKLEKEKKGQQLSPSFLKPKEKKQVERKFIYFLFHPENPKEKYLEFDDEVEIENKKYKRHCKNGIVKTSEKELVDHLIKRGYELLDKIEEDNPNEKIN